LVGEGELLRSVAAEKPVDSALRLDDLGAGGDVEIEVVGVAAPDAVTGADPVMDGQGDRNSLVDAAVGGASGAGGGNPLGGKELSPGRPAAAWRGIDAGLVEDSRRCWP
jgi:hypothetical protein